MNRHGSMNRVYRLVWSLARSAWVPVAETVRGRGKPGRTRAAARARAAATAAALSLAMTPPAHCGPSPTGGQIVSGKGNITQSGDTTTVDQSTQALSIDWASFNIGPRETVDFVQPSANAVAVNRIVGSDGSVILGHLDANGQVYLINPNGVVFGKGAEVDVGGLVASTLALNGSDPAGGTASLGGTSTASVVNQGTINAAPRGYVALLADKVSNTGIITAQLGTVALGAGNALTLTFSGNSLVHLQVDQSMLKSLAQNGGLIQAGGGQVILSAGAKNAVLASVVNNTGVIEARTVENHDGTITLLGGMQAGTVEVGGTLDASAPSGGDGGHVNTSAARVEVADDAHVTTAAAHGLTGSWLIDPNDFTVAPSGGDITGAALSSELGSTSITLESSAGAKAGTGSVNVDDNVSWNANTRLTLIASNNVNINNPINATGSSASLIIEPNTANGSQTASGTGSLTLGTNASITMSGSSESLSIAGGYTLGAGATINLPNASPTSNTALVIGGSSYTVINSLGAAGSTTGADLQGMEGNLSRSYALGSNINASATAGWNAGEGFNPIGTAAAPFTGVFDGLGHTITGLVIDRPTQSYVGLFGYGSLSLIQNVGLVGGSISGGSYTGGLMGMASGATINNSYNTGSVSGSSYVGGVVGEVFFGGVSNSHASGPVTGTYCVGGLMGALQYGSITNSYATGAVTGTTNVGGLVGFLYGQLNGSYATGAVTGTGNVGGLVGASSYAGMYGSYATGRVSGVTNVGGLVGQLFGAMSNDYATGSVTGTGDNIGGLVGRNSLGSGISSSYATGSVTGGSYVGGLVGYNDTNGSVSSSYATGRVSGGSYVGGLVGYNGTYGSVSNSYATGTVSGGGVVGGLVGYNATFGTVSNSYATGGVDATSTVGGGLVGYNFAGTINDSYATGSVSGSSNLGGLVGFNNVGLITNSYATGGVAGGYTVGGLVGYNYGTISNVYSTGRVTGSSEVGGLIGYSYGGFVVSNGYWNVTTSGLSSSAAGKGLTTAQMQTAANFSGFTFTTTPGASDNNWVIVDTDGSLNNSGGVAGATYPMLASEYSTTIANAHQLQLMTMNLSADYVLAANIDATGTGNGTDVWASTGFAPVGNAAAAFGGIFDGQGNTITGLTINLPTQNHVGLIGFSADGSTIRNVGLIGGSINGGSGVGGLVGYNEGTVSDSYATGNVSGSGTGVGGLVGYNSKGTITNSYATGGAGGSGSGANSIGGLVGENAGTISDSYSTGGVSGSNDVGGLVGYNNAGSVANSFWNVTTSGQSTSAGGLGLTTAQMQTQANFTSATSANGNVNPNWDFTNTWVMYNGYTYPLLTAFMTPLTVTASGDTFTYNASAFSGGAGVTYSATPNANLLGSLSYGGSSQGASNVGSYAITPQGLYSTQQGYDITFVSGTLTINPAPVTVSGLSATSRPYNGSTLDTLSGIPVFSGLQGGQTLTLGTATATLSGANAGTEAATADITLASGTGLAGNYVLTQQPSLPNVTITPAPVTITGLSGTGRTYNGSTVDALSGTPVIDGLVSGQTLKVGNDTNGTLASANAGSEAVTTGITLSNGTGLASNYTLTQPTLSNVTITQLGSVTWVGPATGNWATAANWAGGAIPDFSNVAAVTIPAGKTVDFSSAVGPTTLQKLVSSGTLDLTSGTLDVAGNMTTAGFDQTGGTLDVGGAFTVRSTSAGVSLGNIDAGSMSINSTAGAITQLASSALVVSGTTTLTADNGVSGAGDIKYPIQLTNSTNKLAGAVSADGSTITLDDDTGLTIRLDSTSDVSLTAAGAMDVSGTVGANLTTVTTGGTASTTTFGTTTVGDNLDVTSPGAVTTTTPATKLIVDGAGTHTANAHVTVNGVNGAIIK